MLDSFDNAENSLLESPTGTGKTLSLLTGSLAWLQQNIDSDKNTKTKIIYASRTHSQISQLMSELKSTCYKPSTCVLASRQHLCIHPDLANLGLEQRRASCQAMVPAGKCKYMNKLRKNKQLGKDLINHVVDIEDLVKIGLEHEVCPYFLSKLQLQFAHIIFLPYIYILNEEMRSVIIDQYGNNSIIIFDEAHNVAKGAEEGFSHTTSIPWLQKIFDDLKKFVEHKNQDNDELKKKSFGFKEYANRDEIVNSYRLLVSPLQKLG